MTISIAEREAATSAELHNLQELMSKSVNDPFSDFNRLKHQSLLLKLSLYQTILAQPQSNSLSQELYALVDLYERRLDVMLIGANDSSQYMQSRLKQLGNSSCFKEQDFPIVQRTLDAKQLWLATQTENAYLKIMQILGLEVEVKIAANAQKLKHLYSILQYVAIFIMGNRVKIELHFPANIAEERFADFSDLLCLTDYMSKEDRDLLIDVFASNVCKDNRAEPAPPARSFKCTIM